MKLGDSDKMNDPQPLDPMVWDKARAEENDRARDHGDDVFVPGSSWATECAWAAINALSVEDREYYISEVAMISEGAADEVRVILKEGW